MSTTRKPNCWDLVAEVADETENVLLYGPPGTGKSFAAATDGVDHDSVETVTLTDGSTEAAMLGHFIVQNGDFVWMDGPASRAWRKSHEKRVRFVANEIDLASDEVQTALYAIFDNPLSPGTRLVLPNGEPEIRPGEHFHGWLTMNGDLEDIPEALVNRCTPILIDKIHPAALAQLPEGWRVAAEQSILSNDRGVRLSIRNWLRFQRYLAKGKKREIAGVLAFGANYGGIIDGLDLAEAQAVIPPQFIPTKPTANGEFTGDFTSWEDIPADVPHFCGWCGHDDCSASDAFCTYTRFADEDEFLRFCREYDLDTDVDDEDAAYAVRRHSVLYRTRSRVIDPDSL